MITVWTQTNCPGCNWTKAMLKNWGLEYEERDLLENPQDVDKFRSEGFTQSPIVDWDGEVWQGHNPKKLKERYEATSANPFDEE